MSTKAKLFVLSKTSPLIPMSFTNTRDDYCSERMLRAANFEVYAKCVYHTLGWLWDCWRAHSAIRWLIGPTVAPDGACNPLNADYGILK